MKTVYDVLQALNEAKGKNQKIELLNSLKGTEIEELVKTTFFCTYSKTLDYYTRSYAKTPKAKSHELYPIDLGKALSQLVNNIASRTYTGNAAKDYIGQLASMLTEDDEKVLSLVLQRDLKCGVNAKTVNKVWENLIPIHPYMRCSEFNEKNLKNIKFPCYTQEKADGLYVDIISANGSVVLKTRAGETLYLGGWAPKSLTQGFVYQGEVIVLDEEYKNPLDRSASNGYMNSNEVDPSRIRIYVWDRVPYEVWSDGTGEAETKESYKERFNSLIDEIEVLDVDDRKVIYPIDTRVCNNVQDIINHFKEVRQRKLEGIVIKDMSGKWADGTSKYQIKVKVIIEVDLALKGWYYGKPGTKYERSVGGLNLESSDGKVKVNVGSGLSDADRDKVSWFDNLVQAGNTVVTIKCNDLTIAEGSDTYSLFLPRFKEVRMDKNEADSFEKIEEQIRSFTNMLSLIGG